METASNIQELIRVIGDSSSKFSSTKNIVVEIKTWDNRVVRGSNYEGFKRPDIISRRASYIDGNLLRTHVRNLLRIGKSFVVRNGQIDDACFFEWTISDN